MHGASEGEEQEEVGTAPEKTFFLRERNWDTKPVVSFV